MRVTAENAARYLAAIVGEDDPQSDEWLLMEEAEYSTPNGVSFKITLENGQVFSVTVKEEPDRAT